MRLTLDNHKSYDLLAMYSPVKLERGEAWATFRANLRAWPNAWLIPFKHKVTLIGLFNWLLILIAHTLSLFLLPLLCVFGYSTKAYAFFTQADNARLHQYKHDLKQIYAKLSGIKDIDEYRYRLKEEISKIKPFS